MLYYLEVLETYNKIKEKCKKNIQNVMEKKTKEIKYLFHSFWVSQSKYLLFTYAFVKHNQLNVDVYFAKKKEWKKVGIYYVCT